MLKRNFIEFLGGEGWLTWAKTQQHHHTQRGAQKHTSMNESHTFSLKWINGYLHKWIKSHYIPKKDTFINESTDTFINESNRTTFQKKLRKRGTQRFTPMNESSHTSSLTDTLMDASSPATKKLHYKQNLQPTLSVRSCRFAQRMTIAAIPEWHLELALFRCEFQNVCVRLYVLDRRRWKKSQILLLLLNCMIGLEF